MSILDSLAPTGPFMEFFVYAAELYGVRYLVMAAVAFLIARPVAGWGWGRVHADAPAVFDTWRNVRRELWYSFLTVIVFGLVNAALFGWEWFDNCLMYFDEADYPEWWFWLSIPAMLLLHDTLFYWLHRVMHARWLYGVMHRVHHQSVHPTAFAAYSFHPSEAVGEALIVVAIIYIIPVHPLAFLIFQTISTAYNVYGHCGREFYPAGTATHWLGRWINTSTAHAMHHSHGRYNYGFYFLFWDRLMGTLDPAYGVKVERP
ncbi:hypothetical protein FGKAn22_02440 [Ferrigenium kumadai]|uniref:Fatty acid hydroxylase domain-containing protein n=1 Tax=Ferrigenium kumadai TaxID=1682490 RepID=A0AAN1SXT1_9PROT|nr:sterol desaturase family protein [Ferrigenium kumadai]BBI98551.1 hypothetical protein FGKAn22_02440 [Ferrigenium kumadai]